MKKILGISLVAVLTAMPLIAGAEPVGTGNTPAHDDNAVAATAVPGYALAQENDNDINFATAGYVKGAYNAAIKAVNKVATTANSAVQSVVEGDGNGQIKVDGQNVNVHGLGSAAYTDSDAYATAAQGAKADTAVQSVIEGDGNGQIKVDGQNVNVHGLGSAAYTDSDAYATAAQGAKADTALQSTDIATSLTSTSTNDQAAGAAAVYAADTALSGRITAIENVQGDYATKTGVEDTIESATYSTSLDSSTVTGTVSVPTTASYTVMETWGSDTPTTNRTLALGGNTNVNLASGTVSNASFTTSATSATYPAN